MLTEQLFIFLLRFCVWAATESHPVGAVFSIHHNQYPGTFCFLFDKDYGIDHAIRIDSIKRTMLLFFCCEITRYITRTRGAPFLMEVDTHTDHLCCQQFQRIHQPGACAR